MFVDPRPMVGKLVKKVNGRMGQDHPGDQEQGTAEMPEAVPVRRGHSDQGQRHRQDQKGRPDLPQPDGEQMLVAHIDLHAIKNGRLILIHARQTCKPVFAVQPATD